MEEFDRYWNEYIKPLKGKEINTVTGKTNKIIEVTDNYLERRSSEGNNSKVKKTYFENVYRDLIENKTITRAAINEKYGKRCSSIVTPILEEFPNVHIITFPTITLKIK